MDFSKTLHVVVDVQRWFTQNLSQKRQAEFPRNISCAVNKLKAQGIPTLWIAVGVKTPMASPLYENKNYNGWDKTFSGLLKQGIDPNLYLPMLDTNDVVFLKFSSSPFQPSASYYLMTRDSLTKVDSTQPSFLADAITKMGFDHLLMSGMDTKRCLKDSILGGLEKEFKISVLSDLIADSKKETARISDFVGFNVGCLRESLGPKIEQIKITTLPTILDSLDPMSFRPDMRRSPVFKENCLACL